MKITKQNILCALAGALIFILIYGFIPLDVTNDKWICNGYTEPDIIVHYAGWMEYRNSDWSWPLGKIISTGGDDCSNYISFTDSIPLLAITCKVFRKVLPSTFQYFGWYIMLCFILQGFFAGKLVNIFTNNKKYIYLSSVLVTCSPVLIERSFRHTALASHWLILAALYLYFNRKNINPIQITGIFFLLNILAVLIHPYFVPMILGILCVTVLMKNIDKKIKDACKYIFFTLIINLMGIILTGYAIGLLGTTDVTSPNYLGGFGYFSMNLNALINPISQGYGCFNKGSKWSIFLPARVQTLGNYDGFNYLGIGILGLLMFMLLSILCKKSIRTHICSIFKKNYVLCILMIGFSIYAVSNTVTFDNKILFVYDIPHFLYPIFSTFKASSRYFYPVLYAIDILLIYFLITTVKEKTACILISFVIIAQIIDFSHVLIEKRILFTKSAIEEEYAGKDIFMKEWEDISSNYNEAFVLDPPNDPSKMYMISYAAGKTGTPNNFNIMNRGSLDNLNRSADCLMQNAIINGTSDKAMYLFVEYKNAKAFKDCLGNGFGIRTVNGFWNVYREKDRHNGLKDFDKDVKENNFCNDEAIIVIDRIEEELNTYRVSGFSFINNYDTKEQTIFFVAVKNGERFFLPVKSLQRSDVSEYYNNDKYEYAGFNIYIEKDFVESIDTSYLLITNKICTAYQEINLVEVN